MKKKLLTYLLLCVLLLSLLSGCKTQDVTLQTLLPRENVVQAGVKFLSTGIGENIPTLTYASSESGGAGLMDILYASTPITIEIPSNYSPELNASHEIFLTTQAGTMSIYYDDYQNIFNIPINRKINEETVRVYLSFQPAGLGELLNAWQETLPEPEPEPVVEPASTFPADDSALRASLDLSLVTPGASEASNVSYEPAAYQRESDSPLYYAFGNAEKTELPAGKVLMVAIPDSTETRQSSIVSIVNAESFIIVTVGYEQPAADTALTDTAVLMERADVDVGKPIVFVDTDGNILYVQQLTAAVGEVPTTEPVESATETAPSDAAGGEVGTDQPLEP